MTVSRFRTVLYTIVAIVAVAGLADATYLTVQALTGETLSCGGSPDCFRVLGSSYGKARRNSGGHAWSVCLFLRSSLSPHSQRLATAWARTFVAFDRLAQCF